MFRLNVVFLTPWLVAMGGGSLWPVRAMTPRDTMPSTVLVDAESGFASRSSVPLPPRACALRRKCDEEPIHSASEIQVQRIRFKEGGDTIRTCSSESAQPGERINACTALLLSSATEPDQRAHLYAQRGLAYYRAGAHDMAMADFTIALDIDPALLLALNGRCWIRAIAGEELDDARRDCDAAIAIDPEFHEALDSRAMVSMREGRWKDAWDDFNAAVSLRDDVAVYLYGRGLASLALRNKEEGNADLNRARALDRRIDRMYREFGLDPAEPPFAPDEEAEHAQDN
jgi:lipoprotein NlpI